VEGAGFALALAVFALALLGAIIAGGYVVAARQFRIAAAGPEASAGLYAAEAGLNVALSRLDTAWLDSLGAGGTRLLEAGSLVTDDEYEVYLSRLDPGGSVPATYYLVTSTGRASGPRGGRRQLGLVLRRPAGEFCCDAALSVRGPIEAVEGAQIDGRDGIPVRWASNPEICAGVEQGDLAGIVTTDAGQIRQAEGAEIFGVPPVVEIDTGDHLRDLDRWLRELAALADIEYAPGRSLDGIGPVVGRDGECDRAAEENWGAPDSPGHACFGHFPIIHARGDLSLDSPASGQGILLVEGDLRLSGGFEFYGVLLVRGQLIVADWGSQIFGGARVGHHGLAASRIGGGAVLRRSSCALERAAKSPKLQLPHPLAQFSWFEILE
jgi:hypothetical protein